MNNLRKAALLRWRRELELSLSMVPKDKNSIIKKSALCGFLAGDGSVQIRKERKEDKFFRYQLDLYADDEEMLETYNRFIKLLYNISPKVSFRENILVSRTSQRLPVIDLLSVSKFGIYTWNLPKTLFKVKGSKETWLKAFFSAEGYVGKKYIKIQSVNIKSLKKFQKY